MSILDVDLCSEAVDILQIVHYVYLGIIIVVPIILILVGMFDLAKAVTEKKEDDIKKAQQSLIKKAIAAALVFLVPTVVTILMGIITTDTGYEDCIAVIRGGRGEIRKD